MRVALLLALLLTGAACLYWNISEEDREVVFTERPSAAVDVAGEVASAPRPTTPLLEGRPHEAPPAREPVVRWFSWSLSPIDFTGLIAFDAIAPEEVEDHVAAGAPMPLPVMRSDVVGQVGPFGVRDAATAGSVRWLGVAEIVADTLAPPKPTEETKAPPTTAVRGVVVGEDGLPIEGAEVILYSSFYLRQAYYDHRVRQIGRVFTDAEGAFDVRPIALDTVHFGAQGQVLVTVRHPHLPDLVAQRLPAIVPGQESDVGRLVLPAKGATIHGALLDLEGKAVVGAVVRASGALNPVEYDKTERMVVLDSCPTAATDEQGRFLLEDFAPGIHEVSITVRIDCVLHVSERWEGDREWSPRVQAGNGVRGRVLDPDGSPVEAAVVAGGGNWTPTNADGTFWLDNVQACPLTLEVAHAAWHTVFVPGVVTNAEEITITLERRLSRVTLTVVDAAEVSVPLIAVDWTWPPGKGPGPFVPDSRYWHDPAGVFSLVVPEGALGATVSNAAGQTHLLAPEELLDGVAQRVVLEAPAAAR